MKKPYLFCTLVLLALSACSAAAGDPTQPPVPSDTVAPDPTLAPTTTFTPLPTALPGNLVIPLNSLNGEIPWLPLDESHRPTVVYIGINNRLAPFMDANVRKAFAAATDREAIAAIATRLYFDNVRPATNLTPPETIGRELYGSVGIPFDPAAAKQYLADAGFSDPPSFPSITVLGSTRGAAPGFYQQVGEALAAHVA